MNQPSISLKATNGFLRGGALKPSWNHASTDTDDDSSLSDHGNGYKMTLHQLLGGGVGTVSPIKGHSLDPEQLHHSLRRWKSMDVEKEDSASVVSEAPRRRVVGRTKSQETEAVSPKRQSSRRRMPRRTRSFDDSTPFGLEKPSTFVMADPGIEKTIQIKKQELIQNGDSVRGLSALINSTPVKEDGTNTVAPRPATGSAIRQHILQVEDDSSESGFESLSSNDDFGILIAGEEEHNESAGPDDSKQYYRSEKTLPMDDVLLTALTNVDSFEKAKSEAIVFDTHTKSGEITFDSKGKSEEFKASALFMDSDPRLASHEGASRYPNHLFSGKSKSEVNEVAELQESLRRWKTLDPPSTTLGGVQGGDANSSAKTPMNFEAETEVPERKTTTASFTRPTLQQPEWSQRYLMEQQSLGSIHQPKLPPSSSTPSDSLSMRRGLIKRGESVRGLVAYSAMKDFPHEHIETTQGVIKNDGNDEENQNSFDDSKESVFQATSISRVNARTAFIESKIQKDQMNLSPDPVTDEIKMMSKILESDDIGFSMNEEDEGKSHRPSKTEACPAAQPPDMSEYRDVEEVAPKMTQALMLRSSENARKAPRMQSSRHLLMTQGSFDSRMPKRASSHRKLFPQRSFDAKISAANQETTAPPPKSLAARRGLIKRGESVRGLLAVSTVSESIKDAVVEQNDTFEEDESEQNRNIHSTHVADGTIILKGESELESRAGHLLESADISVAEKEEGGESVQLNEQEKEGAQWEEALEETLQPCPTEFILPPDLNASRMASRIESSRHLQTTQASFDSRIPKRASSHRYLFPQRSFDASSTSTGKDPTTPSPITLTARRGLIKRGESVRGLMAFSAISESTKDPVVEQNDTIEEDEDETTPNANPPTHDPDEGGHSTTSESIGNDSDDSWKNDPTDDPLKNSKTSIEISLDSFLSPQSTLVYIDEMHLLTNKRLESDECDDSTLNSCSEQAVELSVKSNMYSKYRRKLMNAGSVGSTCSPKPAKTPSIQSPIVPSRDNTNVSRTQSTTSGSSDAPMPSRKEDTCVVIRSSDWAHLVPMQLRSHQSFHQISSKISVPTSTTMAPAPLSTNESTTGDPRNSLILEVVAEDDSIHSIKSDRDNSVKSVEHDQRVEETTTPIDIPEKVPTIVRIEIFESDSRKSPTPDASATHTTLPVTVAAEERPNQPPVIYPQRSFEARRRPIELPGGSFDASRLRRPEAPEPPSSRQLVRRGLIARGHSVRVLTLLSAAKPEPKKEEEDVNEEDYAPLPSELTVDSSVEESPTPATPPIHHDHSDVPWEELMASLKKASDELLFPEMDKSYVTLGHLSQNLMDCYGSPQEEYFSPRRSPRKAARTIALPEVSEAGDDDDVYLETSLWVSGATKPKTSPPPVLTRAVALESTAVPVLTSAVESAAATVRTAAAPPESVVVADETFAEEITPALVDHLSPRVAVSEEEHSQRIRIVASIVTQTRRSVRKGAQRHFLQKSRAQNPHTTMTIWTDDDRLDEDLESRIGDDGSTFLEI
jgi:hypothetical protein